MSLVGVLIRAIVTTLAPVILVLIVINDGLVSSFTIHNKNSCIRSQTAIVQSSVYRQPYQLNINDSLRLSDNKGERKRLQVHGNAHFTYLQMSKEEDFFSDLEEGALAGIDTEDVEFVNMNDGELTDEFLAEMQESSPSQIEIMKDILGISGFTYVLAALIVFFFSMNLLLGPGWLGQQIGLEGTGTFTEISDSLPDSVDLSAEEYLL